MNDQTIRIAVKMWFDDNENCIQIYGHIRNWDVSKVHNMDALFYRKRNFNEDISLWDVGSVKSMNEMFYGCEFFNQPIEKWNVVSVESMNYMFMGCIFLTKN